MATAVKAAAALLLVSVSVACGGNGETPSAEKTAAPDLAGRISTFATANGYAEVNERGTGPLTTTQQAVALNDQLTAYKADDLERLGFARGHAAVWGNKETKATLGSIVFEMRSAKGATDLLELQRAAGLGKGSGEKSAFDVPGIDNEVGVKAEAQGGAAYEIFIVKESRFWRLLALFPEGGHDDAFVRSFATDQHARA